jgi:hypothetical protein
LLSLPRSVPRTRNMGETPGIRVGNRDRLAFQQRPDAGASLQVAQVAQGRVDVHQRR